MRRLGLLSVVGLAAALAAPAVDGVQNPYPGRGTFWLRWSVIPT